MNNSLDIVVSGIRPTGFLHLGNYFGAVKNFVAMQRHYNCFFFIADLHFLTTHYETKTLCENVNRVLSEYLACGLDVNSSSIYCQSHVPETTELYLLLNMLSYKGELEKTASLKEKIKSGNQNINMGLLTYPVLMAADILIHRAVKVPVGKDQEQHLEMTRTFANRFNHRYGNLFPEPEAFNFGNELVKVPSLCGQGKMSKSENQNATIYFSDSDEVIRKKISKIKTDGGPTEKKSLMPDCIKNMFFIFKLFAPTSEYNKFLNDYDNCTIRYGELKQNLSEKIIRFISPIREKTEYYLSNTRIIKDVLEKGAYKAQASAKETIKEVKRLMKINYF